MKKFIILAVFLINSFTLFSQSLSLFDVEASAFPTMKAKFFAFDKDGKQINPTISELTLKENSQNRTITNVSCPTPIPPLVLSSVLVIDVSGSMSWINGSLTKMDIAKSAANAWINALPLGQSECAISSFDDMNYLNQDFSQNRNKLLNAISQLTPNGGTDYDAAFINPMAGGLKVSTRGKNQRVIVFLTDGQPWQDPQVTAIVAEAKKQNCVIYCVTLGMPAPQSVKDIARGTGGLTFENITSVKEAEDVYKKILQIAQGGSPCEINWLSDVSCNSSNTNVELSWQGIKFSSTYTPPNSSFEELKVNSNFVAFGKRLPSSQNDTTITLTAKNADFKIIAIKRNLGSTDFSIINTTFPFIIPKNTSANITLRFTPSDYSKKYASFEIETDKCTAFFSANGGSFSKKPSNSTLQLTHPNGGEIFIVGSDTLITWTGALPSDTVNLDYSIDNGTSWKLITSQASGLNYKWENVPKPTSQLCLVKVRQLAKSKTKSSDTVFTLSGHSNMVLCVAYNPDGSTITSGSADNTIKTWDANTGALIRTLAGHSSYVYSVSYSPDGSSIASGSYDKTIKIWDANNGALLRTLTGHNNVVYIVTYSPNGSTIASVSADSTIKIWDANTGTLIRTLIGNSDRVFSVAYSPDGSTIVTGNEDNTIKIWDTYTGTLIRTIFGHTSNVLGVSYSPDGSTIASGSDDGTAKIWDANTGALLHTLTGHNNIVISVAYSPDGSSLASGSVDNTIKIWDANTGALLRTLNGHTSNVASVAFSPDGSSLASCSYDKTIKIWDIDGSALQEDVSNAKFSIVAVSPLSQNIDMKQCLVNRTKDSLVSSFIQNKGTYPFRVDSIAIIGNDANQFMIVSGLPPFDILANDTKSMEFRFKPSSEGIKTAQIVVYTNSDTLIQKIKGNGIAPTLSIINNVIDFGQVGVGNFKDSLNVLTIKNIGITDITINSVTHSGPNSIDFSTILGGGPFILTPNESAKMNLRFSPKELGRTSGRLLFDYNGIGSPAVVQLFGEAFEIKKYAAISSNNLTIPNLTCKTQKDTVLEIKNEGLDTLKLKSYKIQGPNPNEFKLNQDISTLIVLPDSVLKVPFSFTPFSSGSKSADLIIESNAIPDSVYVLKLQAFQDSVNIAPNIKQIDLGTLCPNTSKDTLISLENYGTLETGFDIVYDKDLSSTNNKTTLLTNEKYALAIKFDGLANEGTFSRKVKILDKICGKEEIVDLVGTIEDTKIQTTIEILKAKIGQTDQKELIIYNKSNHPINITSEPNIAPFAFVSSYFPLTINKNDSAKLQVSYLFVDKLEKKVNVSLSAEPCNANTNFELKAQSGSNPKAKITTNVYSAYPGDIIEIPFMIKDTSDLNESTSNYLKVDLKFNATLLEPIENTPIGSLSEDKKFRTIPLVLPTKAATNGILGTFKFKVGLGNDSTTKLDLKNQISDSNDVELTAESGVFNLLGICRAAGPRLINPNGEVMLSLIRPNPVGDNGELDIETIENGQTELYIVNLKGEKVATLYQGELAAGKQTLIISTKYLSNGTYFVILQTPTVTQKVKMEVVK
jgi:WD40 repeat protein/uncharacterized protein YegL